MDFGKNKQKISYNTALSSRTPPPHLIRRVLYSENTALCSCGGYVRRVQYYPCKCSKRSVSPISSQYILKFKLTDNFNHPVSLINTQQSFHHHTVITKYSKVVSCSQAEEENSKITKSIQSGAVVVF